MRNIRGTYRLVAAGLLAMVAVLTVFVVLGGHKDVPDRDIPTPAPAFAADTMYVAPGDTGEDNGGEDNAEDESDVESENVTQDQQESEEEKQDESAENTRKDDGSDRGGNKDGKSGDSNPNRDSNPKTNPKTNPNSGSSPNPNPKKGAKHDRNSGPSADPDSPPGPVMPDIFTNLGNYRSINANTPAPSKVALTLDGKSGLSRTDRKLYFYAKPSEETGGYSVLVEYANSSTGGQNVELAGSGNLYGLPVALSDGAYTDVTLTLVDSHRNRTNRSASYRITYEGRKGPSITLNITDGQRIAISPFALTVSARDADGARIYSDHIDVKISGAGQVYNVALQSAGDPCEYKLDFTNYLLEGDDTLFDVTVKAWDTSIEQASTTVTQRVVYEHHAHGDKVGEATIVIDATPVGLGVVTSFNIDLHQGYPFPQDLTEGLNDVGMRPNYTGTFGRSFYLSGITAGGMFSGQSIPDELMHKIEQDKITYSGSHSNDSLSDHDYTNTSGWLYNVNDSWWPGVSLDGYTPTPGDVVYLIFSVAGGKDVGSPNGGTGGALSSYCGIWRNGTYTEMHDLRDYKVVEEPTCSNPGWARYVCSVPGCGAWGSTEGSHADGQQIEIPATGEHNYELDPLQSEAPAEGEDGFRYYVCTSCGAWKTEVWPWVGQWPPDDPDPSGGSDNPSGGSEDPSGGSVDPSGGSVDPGDDPGGGDNPGGGDDPGGGDGPGGGDDPGGGDGPGGGDDSGGDGPGGGGEPGGDGEGGDVSVSTQTVRTLMRLMSLFS